MAVVTYLSMDAQNRTATFDVDGQQITRNIAYNYSDFGMTIDDYLQALADGLRIEALESERMTAAISENSTLSANQVLCGAAEDISE